MPGPIEHLLLSGLAKASEDPTYKNAVVRQVVPDELRRALVARMLPQPLPPLPVPPVGK